MTSHADKEGPGKRSEIPGWNLGEISQRIDVEIGEEERDVEVGGCSVKFPAGCLLDTETVTIAAEINKNKWPKDKEGITPILYVNVINLQKPATVKLHTWCNGGLDGKVTDLMYYDENWVKWKHHSSPTVDNYGFIEFQTDHFTRWQATLANDANPTYAIKPKIYVKHNMFGMAMVLDTVLATQQLLRGIEQDFGKDVTAWDLPKLQCERKKTIRSCITCPSQHGLRIVASDSFAHAVQKIITQPVYNCCRLTSDQYVPNINIDIKVTLKTGEKNDPDPFSFIHRIKNLGWNLGKTPNLLRSKWEKKDVPSTWATATSRFLLGHFRKLKL